MRTIDRIKKLFVEEGFDIALNGKPCTREYEKEFDGEAFEPKEAKRLLDKLEFVYTPKHGSWLNTAEIELNVLMGQCLKRRIADIETVQQEVKAWMEHRNNLEATINWQFTTDEARVKLKRLYPSINT